MSAVSYRPKGFAAAVGVSERLVWRWITSGYIRSHKVGRCRLIPASEAARIAGESAGEAARPSIPISPRASQFLKRMRG